MSFSVVQIFTGEAENTFLQAFFSKHRADHDRNGDAPY